MSPQLFQQMSIQQQEKVISVTQTQLDAKAKEVEALKVFEAELPDILWFVVLNAAPNTPKPVSSTGSLQDAAKQYLSAKHAQAQIEFEQLQLTLLALKSMHSPITVARLR